MAEEEKKPDPAYIRAPSQTTPGEMTGREVTDSDEAYRRWMAGEEFIGKEEAQRLVRRDQVETPGALQSAALGLGQGVSGRLLIPALGALAPADTPEAEEYRRTRIDKASNTAAYKAAEALGFIAPMFLTGGGAGAARMGAAGVLPAAGGLAERAAASLLPRLPGLLGEVGGAAITQGARGAAEGALLGLGDAATQAYTHGNPFTAQAALSSLADGALMGGIAGSALGAGTASLGHVAQGLGNALSRDAEEGARKVFGRMGIEAKQAEYLTQRAGSASKALEELRPLMEEGNFDPRKVHQIAKRVGAEHQEVRMDIMRKLDQEAPAASSMVIPRAMERIKLEVVGPHVGTTLEQEANYVANGVIQKLQYAEQHGSRSPWLNMMAERDGIQAKLQPFIDGTKASPLSKQWAIQALNAVDASMSEALLEVDAGLAKRFGAATLSRDAARIFEEGTANQVSRAMQDAAMEVTPGIKPRDLLVAGAIGSYSPIGAAAGLAAKGLTQMAADAIQPAVTKWLTRSALGATAEKSAVDLRGHIQSTLKDFFNSAPRAVVAGTRQKKGPKYSADDTEKAMEKVQYLISPRHQSDVAAYLKRVADAGQPDLADAMGKVNQAAVKQAMDNLPVSMKGRSMQNMTKHVKLQSPTIETLKFLNRMKGVMGGPLSLLESMKDGSLSKEQVDGHKAVWGDVHDYIIGEAQKGIMQAQQEGTPVSMDKVAMLSLVTGTPMNSFMTPEYIQEVQNSFAVEEKAAPPEPATPNPVATAMQTPLEKSLA